MDSENSLFYGVTKLLFMESENTKITTRLDLTLVMLWVYTRVQIDIELLYEETTPTHLLLRAISRHSEAECRVFESPRTHHTLCQDL